MRLAGTAYIPFETVLAIHKEQIKAFGGQDGIRDRGAIESAVELPRQGYGEHDFYPTVFDKAAVYAYHIAESQGFIDGNKRTALVTALAFLAINGYKVKECRMELHSALIAVAKKEMDREGLADLFRDIVIDSY